MNFYDGYLSDLVGRPAVLGSDAGTQTIGKVTDFLVRKPDDTFPRIDGLVIKTKDGKRYAPMSAVRAIQAKGAIILSERPVETPLPGDQALYLIEDLFDKQIVDVDGRKVVRINDLEIANTGGALRVVAADIGMSGLLQRLGAGRLAPKLFERMPRTLIAWDNVAPLGDVNPVNVKLSVAENRLSRLHPSELADIIEELSAKDAARIVGSLDDETAADAFEHLDADRQQSIIDDLGSERAADIIEEMDSDDAADLLGELDEDKRAELLAKMDDRAYAGELEDLVEYAPDTAGGLMTTDYLWIFPHRTTSATIDKIREIGPESEFIYYLYVTDERRKLLGIVSLRALLLALPTAFIHKLMDTDVLSVGPETSAQDVASTIARYDLLAVPVLDAEERMLGIVTVDDAIDAIMPEKIANSLPRMVRHHAKRPVLAG
ncbi:MAG: magnesium transporter [Candidatus Eremiobacteraeota bacterium]|nr:magnesium transporter [Candidatus Eremiobacteraeota bacterium]MBC5822848.1 magnesium transporter [Candidatus Eremiobacteraeota bacterium]